MTSEAQFESISAAIQDAAQTTEAVLPPELMQWVIGGVRRAPHVLRLPILTCEAAEGDPAQAAPVAAAWHLLYCAAHLLDDVEDGATERPADAHRMTNWGTALIFVAQRLLVRAARWGLPAGRVLALVDAFATSSLHICIGQDADLAVLPGAILDLPAYWRVVSAKAGEPFALACRAGALLGAQPEREIDIYSRYGYHLGILMQLGDDLRAVWQPRNRADLNTAGRTLPVVYAYAAAAPAEQVALQGLLRRAPDDPAALRALQAALVATRSTAESGAAVRPAGTAIEGLPEPAMSAVHYLALHAVRRRDLAREVLLSLLRPSTAQHELLELLDKIFPALSTISP